MNDAIPYIFSVDYNKTKLVYYPIISATSISFYISTVIMIVIAFPFVCEQNTFTCSIDKIFFVTVF